MSFPRNKAEMLSQGYTPAGSDRCRSCAVVIEFWMTPHQRRIPMNVMDGDSAEAVSHWATCPDPERFRRKAGHR
jgi:hypothetical protein